ncbi:MAG TPA: proteasome subunit alpha [Armatimonadota bacterium]|nr:proteasome subunit alpha [Armatimonadota bacterium]HOM80876.1 proteasome subunit alpha [Armatimonadota bacterium]HPO72320.1 proteasome subunit alpha [Armatimonadota bacterium]
MAALEHCPSGDFLDLLRRREHPFAVGAPVRPVETGQPLIEAHGTTVLAVKYAGGVLNVGDRRATSANAVMYDRAEKILEVDDTTLLAISGSYARALEVVRYLRHAFHYYRRTQLQEMSLEGKLSEVSRVVAQNVASAMSGLGAFLPVISVYDATRGEGRIFFYDGLGARFESEEWGAAGSGAERIRGAFDYILKTKGRFRDMSLDEALSEALVLLDIAAEMDAMTGGYDKVLPSAKAVSAAGIEHLPEERLREAVSRIRRGA